MAPVTKRPTDNMARQIVVRSITAQDIVGFIDRMFLGDDFFRMPWKLRLPISYAPQMAALLELVRLLPIADTPSDPTGYIEYLTSLVAIRHVMEGWRSRDSSELLEYYPALGDLHPLGLIRRALAEVANKPNVVPVIIAEVKMQSLPSSAIKVPGSHKLIELAPEDRTQAIEGPLIIRSIAAPRSFAEVNVLAALPTFPTNVFRYHDFVELNSNAWRRADKQRSNKRPKTPRR